jgi:dipicolinate synthase subunit A
MLNKEYMSCLPKHAKVYSGVAKFYLKNLCAELAIDLIELLSRDDVAIYNSISTAEGALLMAIQHTDITIHGSRCMVLGLGRIGLTLADMLHRLGAYVKTEVQKPEQFCTCKKDGD